MIRQLSQAAQRDILLALLVILLGTAGLLDIRHGTWRPGPGVGNHLIPMIVHWVFVLTGLALFAGRIRTSNEEEPVLTISLAPVLGGLLWAGLYFLAVRHVGVAVATTGFMAIAIWALSHSDERKPFSIWVVSMCAGAVFWVLFTQLAPILLASPILF